jgi:hypothetical protein
MFIAVLHVKNERKNRFYSLILFISCLYLLPVFLILFQVLVQPTTPAIHRSSRTSCTQVPSLSSPSPLSLLPLYPSLLSPVSIITPIRSSIRSVLGVYPYPSNNVLFFSRLDRKCLLQDARLCCTS